MCPIYSNKVELYECCMLYISSARFQYNLERKGKKRKKKIVQLLKRNSHRRAVEMNESFTVRPCESLALSQAQGCCCNPHQFISIKRCMYFLLHKTGPHDMSQEKKNNNTILSCEYEFKKRKWDSFKQFSCPLCRIDSTALGPLK